MSSAKETKDVYLQICMDKQVDVNAEVMYLISVEEENDE